MINYDRRRFLQFATLGGSFHLLSKLINFNPIINHQNASKLLAPDRLSVGDKVAIIGLAGAVWNPNYIDSFKETLNAFGLKPWFAPSVLKKFGYLSGNDEERLADLKNSLLDPEVKAIFFIRGGWGSARIMDKIDWEWFSNNPKIIIGFSDMTYLLNAASYKTGLVTFHGPVGYSGWNDFTKDYVRKILFQPNLFQFKIQKNNESEIDLVVHGEATGLLIGGNLCVFHSMLGSEYFPDCKNKILFLEETEEEPYCIDRMLTSLRLAGVFSQINGLIFGQFNDCKPEKPEQSFTLNEVLHLHFDGAKFPVLTNAPFGHTPDKWTLPIGVEVTMNTESSTITLLNRPVN